MKKFLSLLLMMVLLSGAALAQGTVYPVDATNLTVELPDDWSARELMPTDVMNGVLLVAYNADMSVSFDIIKESYTAEEMQANVDQGAQLLEINGIPYVMLDMSNGICYFMTEYDESSVLTFTVYADDEAYAANAEALEQLLGSLKLSSDTAKSEGHYQGTVQSFNNRRGYGYIISDNGDMIFVHYMSLNMVGFKSLEVGQRVSFDIIEGMRGTQATNVTID